MRRGLTRTVVMALLVAASACNHSAKTCQGSNCPCYTMADCGSDICFLGTCQSPGYNISTVYVDLLPSATSGLLAQADAQTPRNLSAGLNFDITLRGTVAFSGSVQAASGATLGGLLQAKLHPVSASEVVLPSALNALQAVVTANAQFNLAVIPGIYDLSFAPSQSSRNPVPPQALPAFPVLADTHYTFAYPDTSLVSVSGTVLASTTPRLPVAGVSLSGRGTTAAGVVLDSTQGVSDSGGAYSLIYLPGANSFAVTVHPGTAPSGNVLVPTMNFSGLVGVGQPPVLPDLVLNIPATVQVTLAVVDSSSRPVSNAALFLDGTVGTGTVQGTFSATGTTDGQGKASLQLIPGTYTLNVVPSSQSTTAAATLPICVLVRGAAVPIACAKSVHDQETLAVSMGNLVTASGKLVSHLGSPVANARVSFIPLNDAGRRQFAVVTQADGSYSLGIDPPAAGSATLQYEVQVEPDASSGLPRHRELLLVGTEPLHHDIQLFAPSFVYGRVLDPQGSPLSDVTIALYSSDLGSAGQPLLVGLGKSTTGGQFVIPLPIGNN